MKALFKFLLLLALIVGGKLSKQAAPTTVANTPARTSQHAAPVIMVHQVLTSEPVEPASQPPQWGSTTVTEMF